jgi:hypothetical protein
MRARDVPRRSEYLSGSEMVTPQLEAADSPYATERDLPIVPSHVAQMSASNLAFGDPNDLDRGMHEVEEYRAACEAASRLERWQPHYVHGHTEATGFTQPYEQQENFLWSLQKGYSASQALKDFITGRTIADYRAIAVAQLLDDLRDDLGDRKFDQLFGSKDEDEDAGVADEHRLTISSEMYTTPFADHMKQLAGEYDTRPTELDLLALPIQRQDDEGHDTMSDEEEPNAITEELGRPDRELS